MDQWICGAGGAGNSYLDSASGYTGVYNCQNTSDHASNTVLVSECKLALNKVSFKKVHSLPFSPNENMLN